MTLERDGKARQFKPSAKGKWDVLAPSTMQVSVGDQVRVTAGFREEKNVFKNNDIAELREITDTELVLHDGRRMRRDGARIDQGVCITSYASQCRTVDQVVLLPDGADAKGWYVSLSRAREAMHVYTRNKLELSQSVMQPGERKSVWELLQALQRSKPQPGDRKMPDLWATRQPNLSVQARWNRVKSENPELFGKLQARDWEADDQAEEREREETHGAFQPSAPSQHQFSLAEHMALFAKLQGPKKVEATHQEGFICVGGFSNPLF